MFTKILSVARLTFKSVVISFDSLLLHLTNSMDVVDGINFHLNPIVLIVS